MSETVIVNRTPETDGLRRERIRLESETQGETTLVAQEPDQVKSLVPFEPDQVKTVYQVPVPAKGEAVVLPPHHGSKLEVVDTTSAQALLDQAINNIIDPIVEKAAEDLGFAAAAAINQEPSLQEIAAQILAKRAPRDPDLAEFKQQVIAAFKHLGLDTRKHFGV